ncbi:MAG: LamG-like jellyroll fold domain-containing protein [Bacteroidota bacterium]
MKNLIIILFFLFCFAGLSLAQPCLPNPNSVSFNGASSAVRINSTGNLEMTDAITIEAWVKANTFATFPTGGSIFCHHSWGNSSYGYVLRAGGSGQVSFNIGGAVGGSPVGWQEVVSNTGAIATGTWYHVAATFDGTALNLYVNGSLVGTTAFAGEIYPSIGYKPRIGALSDTAWSMSRYWDGLIDEVRVWHRALSVTEIAAGMNDHVDPATALNLAGYWRLNDSPGAVCQDLSGNGNTGVGINIAWSTVVPFNNATPPIPTVTFVSGALHSSATTGNQWYFGTNLLTGATQQNYTPTQYGNYTVKVSTISGCSSTSTPFNYNTTGIESPNAAELSFSPNPAHETLQMKVPAGFFDSELSIYSLNGQLLMMYHIANMQVQTINIEALSPGIYLIQCKTPAESKIQKLVVW